MERTISGARPNGVHPVVVSVVQLILLLRVERDLGLDFRSCKLRSIDVVVLKLTGKLLCKVDDKHNKAA